MPPVPFAGLLKILIRASLDPADCLFLFHATLLALGYKPALAAYRAQDAALDDLLPESLQEHILRLITAQIYDRQLYHLLPWRN